MTGLILLEVLIILMMIVANGAFAMSEIALVRSSKVRLQEMARRGNENAQIALDLTATPNRFLSTVQIGITLIGVLAGAFGGATLAGTISQAVARVPSLEPYSDAIGVGSIVLAITYLTLVIGELAPKRIALGAPERIGVAVAPAMRLLSRVAAPFVSILTWSTRALLRLLRIRPIEEPPVTEQELRSMVWAGARAGTIRPEEQQIIERAFRLDDRPVSAIMTPREEIEWVDLDATPESQRQTIAASAHDWFPVSRGSLDEIVGFVRGRDLWTEEGGIETVLSEPVIVSSSESTLSMLDRFRDTKSHLLIVRDSATIRGLLTPTDILEALVGELPEAHDPETPMIIERTEGSWSIDARADLEEVKLLTGVRHFEAEKDVYQSVAGYLVDRLGRVPKRGDSITTDGIELRVIESDGRRVDRVLVTVRSEE